MPKYRYMINIDILSCGISHRFYSDILFMSSKLLFHNGNFHVPFIYAILVHTSYLSIGYL